MCQETERVHIFYSWRPPGGRVAPLLILMLIITSNPLILLFPPLLPLPPRPQCHLVVTLCPSVSCRRRARWSASTARPAPACCCSSWLTVSGWRACCSASASSCWGSTSPCELHYPECTWTAERVNNTMWGFCKMWRSSTEQFKESARSTSICLSLWKTWENLIDVFQGLIHSRWWWWWWWWWWGHSLGLQGRCVQQSSLVFSGGFSSQKIKSFPFSGWIIRKFTHVEFSQTNPTSTYVNTNCPWSDLRW